MKKLVLLTTPMLSNEHGGMPQVVRPLCAALKAHGCPHLRFSLLRDSEAGSGLREPPRGAHMQELRPSLIHDHGAWVPFHLQTFRAARALGIPLVVSPHGMLERWALRHKRLKKLLAWHAYQKRIMNAADLIIVNSEREYEGLRALGLKARISVIPNGLAFPESVPARTAEVHRKVLFLSRVNPVKGVLELIDAWRHSRACRELGFTLNIYGNCDDPGYGALVAARIRDWGLQDRVVLQGPVYGEQKWKVYSDHDFFVLPSFSENFGIVVLEALYSGLPVITTEHTPWRDLEVKGLGKTVSMSGGGLREGIDEYAAGILREHGSQLVRESGPQFVLDNFAWPQIAAKYAEVYQWLVNAGDRPADVRCD